MTLKNALIALVGRFLRLHPIIAFSSLYWDAEYMPEHGESTYSPEWWIATLIIVVVAEAGVYLTVKSKEMG